MAIAKVIEVIAESNKSWDDAAQTAVSQAAETVANIQSLWVDNLSATVKKGKIERYRLNAKVTFLVER